MSLLFIVLLAVVVMSVVVVATAPRASHPAIVLGEEGRALIEKAEGGDVTAMQNAAANYMYDESGLLPYDPKESMKWWRKAAEAGSAGAMFELATLLLGNEHGIPVDKKEAKRLLQKAEEGGHAGAGELLKQANGK